MTNTIKQRCDGNHSGACPFVVTHVGSHANDERDLEEMDADIWAFSSVERRDAAAEQLCAFLISKGDAWPFTWSVWRSLDAHGPFVSLLYTQVGDADFSMTGMVTPIMMACGGIRQPVDGYSDIFDSHAGHLIAVEEGIEGTCPEMM
jgi:hypothetical protein